jgi:ATP:corrinoid adenosyltransferase
MGTGLVLVVTGDEAYNSFPVMGQVFRALGRNLHVCIIEFAENPWNGWLRSVPEGFEDLLEVHDLNNYGGTNPRKQWEKAKELINSSKFQLLVMEGTSSIIAKGIADSSEIADCLSGRPKSLNIIIADSNLNGPILDVVDQVTEITDLKR